MTKTPRRRRAVLAVVLLLLGAQLIGGSLHAAGSEHDPASDCQICLAFDRLDLTEIPFIGSIVGPGQDALPATYDLSSPDLSAPHTHPIRAPPPSRRF